MKTLYKTEINGDSKDTGNDTRLVKSVDQSGDKYVFVESVNRAQIMFPILLIC